MLIILYLFNFKVGVNIPFSIENFSLIIKNFLTFSIFERFLFNLLIWSLIISFLIFKKSSFKTNNATK